MINSFYSNSNVLNIPRESYKKEASSNILKAPSLLLGSDYRSSVQKIIDRYESERVSNFIAFLKSSFDNIKSFSNTIYDEDNPNSFDYTSEDINIGSFVNDINNFFDTSDKYSDNGNEKLSILNKQIENDLLENEDELLSYGISINGDNRLEFDQEKNNQSLSDSNSANDINSKENGVFTKLSERIEKALEKPLSIYIPLNEEKQSVLYNYLDSLEKTPLNSDISTGNIIDFTI